MPPKIIYVVCADDEDDQAELLAGPLRADGYQVEHIGTIGIGKSIMGTFNEALASGLPLVLCGTLRTMGSSRARQIIHSAQHDGTHVFPVQMEAGVDFDNLTHSVRISRYHENSAKALAELSRALKDYFGADSVDQQHDLSAREPDTDIRHGYLELPAKSATLDFNALKRFRDELRENIQEEYQQTLNPWDFLLKIRVWNDGQLTRTGALLFADKPTAACPTAMVQCFHYYGSDRSARHAEPVTFKGTIYDQIIETRKFLADRVQLGEAPSPHQVQSATLYMYPMIAVREIIANALVHRDYSVADRHVHVRLFDDRIEVSSPGNWYGRVLDDGIPYELALLKGESIKRNYLLAHILSWIRIIEGEGSGIPSALKACEAEHSPLPIVVQDQGFVIVTLRKGEQREEGMTQARSTDVAAAVDRIEVSRPHLGDSGDEFMNRVAEATRLRVPGTAITERPQAGYLRVARPLDGGGVEVWPVGVADGTVTEAALRDFIARVHAQFAAADPSVRSEFVYGGPAAPPQLAAFARQHGVRLRSFLEYQGLLDLRPLAEAQRARLAADPFYPALLYVDQRFRVAGDDHVRSGLLEQTLRWLAADTARLVVVLGDFGRGKTAFLRQLTRRLPEELPSVMPVLVELRALEKAPTLDELLAQHLVRQGVEDISPAKLRYMMRTGRIALLFDGFDELELRVGYDNAADYLQTLLESVTGLAKVVLTSRSQHFRSTDQVRTALGERVETRAASRVVILEEFSDEQILQFLTNLYDGDARRAHARYGLLGELGNLRGLAHNPRMLAFTAALDESQLLAAQRGEGQLTPAGLYQQIIYSWLHGEAERQEHRGGLPALGLEERLAASTALALRLWTSASATIGLSDLSAEVAATLSGLAERGYRDDQASHAIASGSLLVRTEEGAFAFIHQSVMEWLVADAAARDPESRIFTTRRMSALMARFFIDLAGPDAASGWAYSMLANSGVSYAAKQNALTIIGQLPPHGLRDEHRQSGRQNLAGLDLRGQDLSGTDLHGADLRGALLRGMRLNDVDLSDADLRDADLGGVHMTGGTLRGAIVTGSRWDYAALLGVEGAPDLTAGYELHAAAIAGRDHAEVMLRPAIKPTSVAFSPDGVLLAVGGSTAAEIANAYDGRILRVLRGHTGTVYAVAFSPDGTLLATASADRTARIWDVGTGVHRTTLTGHDSYVNAVAFSPDGTLLATASTDGTARIWDVGTGVHRTTLTGHDNAVNAIAFSPDGQLIATASADSTARTWDTTTGVHRTTLSGHDSYVNAVMFSPDGTLVATTSEDRTARIWDAVTGTPRITLASRENAIHGVAFSPTGTVLATASGDHTARTWDTSTGATRTTLINGHRGTVNAVAFSPDGALLATASDDRTARIWDSATGSLRLTLTGHGNWVRHVAFSPDGALLATASADRTARIWDSATGTPRLTFAGHDGSVNAVAFAPDGTSLATASYDGTARIWDTVTGIHRTTLTGSESYVLSVAFSPDGSLLATASYDGTARIWDTATGSSRATLAGHNGSVRAIVFAPHGGILATASYDGTARIWDVSTGAHLATLVGHDGSVNAVTFAAGGALAATASTDGTARIWDVSTGTHLATLVPLSDSGYAALLPDGDYKIDGDPGDSIWWAIKLCRFAPGELDPYVPSLRRLAPDAPILPPRVD
jgi:WD40 repeat protein